MIGVKYTYACLWWKKKKKRFPVKQSPCLNSIIIILFSASSQLNSIYYYTKLRTRRFSLPPSTYIYDPLTKNFQKELQENENNRYVIDSRALISFPLELLKLLNFSHQYVFALYSSQQTISFMQVQFWSIYLGRKKTLNRKVSCSGNISWKGYFCLSQYLIHSLFPW